MCPNTKPMRQQASPAPESDANRFQQRRQEELNRLKGRVGRSSTILTSPMGDSNFGSNLVGQKVLGGNATVLGAVGKGNQ